jgi:hypothetical protein
MALTGSLRGGLLIHGYQLQAEGLHFSDGATSNAHGSMVGLGAGLVFGKPSQGLGLYYLPSMRGDVEAEGETKIVSTAGLIGMDLVLTASRDMTLGVSLKAWRRDTLSGATATPTDVEYGDGVMPALSAAVGAQWRSTGGNLFRAAVVREGYSGNAGATATSGLESTRIKLALGGEYQGVETTIGCDGRWSPTGADGRSRPMPFADLEVLLLHAFRW